MRGTTTKLPVKNLVKQIYPMRTWRPMTVSAPKKQEANDAQEGVIEMNGDFGQVVAFNRPKLPPVLGPLVLLSVLEMGSTAEDES
ncbi:hypothetical protein IHE45_14G120200 [Dioscorea alata]|uniref:Uncharacterized protein n=4 Tax=Dioscorea alata TaxID=55571 RepID=A0ACB7UUT0_DIOAL|nr:hypothetical protein IHE45_14G120200 [Dioscorea alata]KAH7664438.1 hypothetical protein IHE45_14G120200 [Dioscorea alata]KAH7664439.1 hypothetical protein IHE45_14G120200 [Dioscorea alata]